MKIKLIIFALIFNSVFAFSQKVVEQSIDKPSEGKSLVYFLRYSSTGALLNFRLYDGDKFLYKFPYGEYLVYECDPGKHVFWVTSENRDYVDADLEPNSTYVINIQGQMGAFIASVALNPMNPNEKRDKKWLYKEVKNAKKVIYNPEMAGNEDKTENVRKAMLKYEDLKKNNSSKIKALTADMKFENANKPE
ncbi:hypothetical protein HZP84_10805 [Elizabethkingia anophelis]|uniref:Protein of uncharacterized function (DUF2846) n=2 Tax=Elizabethkingia anophelis TaxID=1117645 RepID=X5KWT6_9FLAO|nr:MULTISPECIES: hypothetical protein [Elizabethkingia]AQX52699.1 hypothetical protein AYC66_06025 [Elizabethkingia anophelis]AQX88609.1 hypothetical protein AYC67_06030 [Elizabethkingia anophelis]ATC37108.1 hypothetical protein BAZ09_013110 [Elizabethkingia anophelis R26]ATC40786.1 hypothetical protein EAAG1_013325 [Elizabethkingia anophelis Ag1]ATC44465.1 hypothetical protein CMV41_13325 [Elizabethkingia anophelis]